MPKISVLFVCLGNICRSPMAQTIFESIIEANHSNQQYEVDSAGLIGYHQGEKADSRMREHAKKRGYTITHRSRPFNTDDFDTFDIILGMDDQNIRGLMNMAQKEEHRKKIYKMTDFLQTLNADTVPDPYYGGNKGFEYVIDLLEDACDGLYKELSRQ